jgi:hypothetical protein
MSNADQVLRGSTRCCPKCGSSRLACQTVGLVPLAECGNCGTRWEPFESEQLVAGDPRGPFKEPCNTCAFRPGDWDGPGADERTPEAWRAAVDQMRAGGTFHCHKGLPIDGDRYVYPSNMTKARLCAGYVRAAPALLRAMARAHQEQAA